MDSGASSYLNQVIVVDREAQEYCPPVQRNRPVTLFSFAIPNHNDYKQFGATEDVDKAIISGRTVLAIARQANPHSYATSLNNLANCLFARYIYLGVLRDLDEVVALDREALDLRPLGHPNRSSSLNNLAVDLSTRYKQLGMLQDLREAITLAREVLDLRPKGHHDRSSALNNLAVHLLQLRGSQDIDEAIILGREAIGLRTTGALHRFSPVNNLAVYLSTRYRELGTLRDLDEATVLGREALDLCLKEQLDRSSSLNHLTLYLLTRYQRLGTLQDLDEVIVCGRDSLDLCPRGHPNRSSSLDNLALYLSTRYKELGALQDLDEVIVLGREVLNLRPEGHPMHAYSLDNLARNLTTRFHRCEAIYDIQEAISLAKEALSIRPKGHPDHPLSLNILASCLTARFKQLGTLQDLDKAIMLGREALDVSPNGHPHRLCSLDCLTRSLSARYKKLGNMQDLEGVLVLVREALDLRPTSHPKRLCSLHVLVRHLSTRCKQSRYFQDLKEAIVLEQEALGLRREAHSSLDVAYQSGRYDLFGALQDRDETILLAREAFDLPSTRDVLLERSKAFLEAELWKEALDDANQVIMLDPSVPWGYELKHAALHEKGDYSDAFVAFEAMLSRVEQSPDPDIRELRHRYVNATSEIQRVIEQTVRHLPRVLIDTETGYLRDKTQQAVAFKEHGIYDKLRSSITTELDHERIRMEVKKFYNYVMFSHKWQAHEPIFQEVENSSVFELPSSLTFSKLQNFCRLVQTLSFKWAWSDTCCINQLNRGVLQESSVSMFKWYRGSSLTIIHLLGVFSESQEIGCLSRSIWNTRGWTYQEYLASGVVQFYTEDWKPYLGLDMFNHKESPIILSEMKQVMDLSQDQLETLRPGLDRAREKLYLVSRRQTTREEDMAYCLFGIFNVALPIIYGEGDQAVGRLLEHILTRSDNVTLLAWTGRPGSHHSYLPAEFSVYDQIVPPHIQTAMATTDMERLVQMVHRSLPSLSQAVEMYDQCWELPPLQLISGRLRLSGIVFPLADLVRVNVTSNLATYRGMSPMLGDVEIETRDELSDLGGFLFHPWISPLLDLDFARRKPLFDRETRALRLVVRLKQPFGALLLTPVSRSQYRRVATDSLIMVRVRENTSLGDLMGGISTVEIQ